MFIVGRTCEQVHVHLHIAGIATIVDIVEILWCCNACAVLLCDIVNMSTRSMHKSSSSYLTPVRRPFCARCVRSVQACAVAPVDAGADATREQLIRQLEGLNRGVFGVQSAKQKSIHDSISLLEAANPTPEPTRAVKQLNGRWKLLYSTIRILGSKRSKLGLREFVQIGDMFQEIDMSSRTAVNTVDFNVSGFTMMKGSLTIKAEFEAQSASRVDVTFRSATLKPDQLEKLFQKNYDLLLEIFNPEGWLEITYLDEQLRVGRDDDGHIFLLEKC